MNVADLSIVVRQINEPGRKLPWVVRWREPARRGDTKRKRPARYFATEQEADEFRDDLITALKTAAAKKPAGESTPKAAAGSVAGYLNSWLTVHVKAKREAATYRSYEGLVRVHIIPAKLEDLDRKAPSTWADLVGPVPTFGELPMTALRPVVVNKLYGDLYRRKVSLAQRRHIHSCLSSACGRAVLDEVIAANPCLNLGRDLRHKGEQDLDPEPNPFTRDEAVAFLKRVEEHEREWFEYFQFLHDTGVRVGEAAALKWDTVDLDRARAEIVASYSPSDGCDKAPKTHQRRWIDLSDLVVDQLKTLRKQQRVETLKAGRTVRQYVFTNRRGSPRRQDGNMRRVFDRVVEAIAPGKTKAEWEPWCKGHSPHDLRDTFATIHLSDNYAKLPWVSRQLGHETERTTVEHYFRFLPSTFTKRFANEIR